MKKYKINEIFYSIQGEGYHAGRAAIFVRFSGCNLHCPFCDTKHENGVFYTEDELIYAINKTGGSKCGFIVITGGEPSLFITKELITRMHSEGYYVAIETNGTKELPSNIDWVTVSPKCDYVEGAQIVEQRIDELKCVLTDKFHQWWNEVPCGIKYLQPCDTGNKDQNRIIFKKVVEYVKNDPTWTISLQTQKILDVR